MTHLEDLTKLRADLQLWIEDAPVDRRAALVAQYLTTLAKIDELTPKEAVGDGIDEVASRRAARRAGSAKGADRTERSERV